MTGTSGGGVRDRLLLFDRLLVRPPVASGPAGELSAATSPQGSAQRGTGGLQPLAGTKRKYADTMPPGGNARAACEAAATPSEGLITTVARAPGWTESARADVEDPSSALPVAPQSGQGEASPAQRLQGALHAGSDTADSAVAQGTTMSGGLRVYTSAAGILSTPAEATPTHRRGAGAAVPGSPAAQSPDGTSRHVSISHGSVRLVKQDQGAKFRFAGARRR